MILIFQSMVLLKQALDFICSAGGSLCSIFASRVTHESLMYCLEALGSSLSIMLIHQVLLFTHCLNIFNVRALLFAIATASLNALMS